jgi:cell division protease FtsH
MTLGVDGVTTGASNDIERATSMARSMVTKWGLSAKLGPLHYGEEEGAYPGMATQQYSGETSRQIDEEVRRIINECYERATKILEDNRDILETMKDALMEYETIDSDQVADLMARRKVRPPREWNDDDFNSHLRNKDSGDSGEKPADPIGGPANTH